MKRLLLAGVLSLIGAAPSFAQVTSINAVGYANVVLKAGRFNLVSNPLGTTAADIPSLFPNMPAGSIAYKYTGVNFLTTLKTAGGTWTTISGTNMTLQPGEGIFMFVGGSTDVTNTFVGEVTTGNLVNNVPTGFSIRSSQVPQAGGVSSLLGLQLIQNDVVYQFDPVANSYSVHLKTGSGTTQWSGGEPNVSVGEAFWILKTGSAIDWTRQFSIN